MLPSRRHAKQLTEAGQYKGEQILPPVEFEQVDVAVNVPYGFLGNDGNPLSQEAQDDRWNKMMDKARSNAPSKSTSPPSLLGETEAAVEKIIGESALSQEELEEFKPVPMPEWLQE